MIFRVAIGNSVVANLRSPLPLVEIDITAIDMLAELREELATKNITFALARVNRICISTLKKPNF